MQTAVIVGAGIGGLAAAIAARRAGWDVRVLERSPSPRELGFALLLAPNAMHALRSLGIAERVIEGGVVARIGEMRRPDGRVLRRMDMAPVRAILGEPAVVALRPVLHGALLDAVGADALVLGSGVVSIAADASGISVRAADGRTFTGRVLIGADGVGSTVRRHLHPGEAPPRSSGLWALRGVARGVVSQLGGVHGIQYFGRGVEAGATQATEDAVYWYISLREEAVRPHAGDARAILESVAAGFHASFQNIVLATAREDLRLDELLERDPLERWGAGLVTLLGDAAHPMLPHAGQGAAQALEDAVALGSALGGAGSPEQALRDYERVRAARAGAIVRVAKRNAVMGSLTGRASTWLRDLVMTSLPDRLILKSIVDMGRPPS